MPSPKYIMDLPPFSTYDLDMWIEAQKEAGGVGSSGRISKATLVQAIVQAITPTQHSELEGLLNDDHPQYFNLERGDARYAPLSHVERTDNPHNVTAAQTGADPAGTAAAAVAAHEAALDPHPQYQTSGEVDSQIDSKVAALKAESDPFPNYQKASEVNGQIDTKIAALKAEADPFPIYETAVEAQAKIDAKMAGHLSASDPHPQYASNEELNAAVLAEVQPVVQQSVDDYLAGSGGAAIDSAIDIKLPPAIAAAIDSQVPDMIAAAIAAHNADLEAHPDLNTGGGGTVILSTLPPTDPEPNTLWVQDTTFDVYVYYDDGTSQQWVGLSTKQQTIEQITQYGTYDPTEVLEIVTSCVERPPSATAASSTYLEWDHITNSAGVAPVSMPSEPGRNGIWRLSTGTGATARRSFGYGYPNAIGLRNGASRLQIGFRVSALSVPGAQEFFTLMGFMNGDTIGGGTDDFGISIDDSGNVLLHRRIDSVTLDYITIGTFVPNTWVDVVIDVNQDATMLEGTVNGTPFSYSESGAVLLPLTGVRPYIYLLKMAGTTPITLDIDYYKFRQTL